MDKLPIGGKYSMKNIPIPDKFEYQKMMALKIESFVRRLRFKMINIQPSKDELNNTTIIGPNNTYGFRTEGKPRHVPELQKFEEDLFEMLRKIEYRNMPNNGLQNELRKTISDLKSMPSVIVSAEKTKNLFCRSTQRNISV